MKNSIIAFALCVGAATVMAQNVVDVHCHNILPSQLAVLEKHHAALEETFPLPRWYAASHLKFMDEAGISRSVLSMPAPQPYYGNSKECQKAIRSYNEQSAQLKAAHPNRFLFCASLPLPDVDAAIREAIFALDSLKADGIKLATNSRGQYLGDAALDPLMKVLNDRKAVVIIHPHKPVPVNDSIIGTTPLAIYEYTAETTRAVINMVSRNVLARYPDLKVIVPHCGSFLPLAIPRMQAIHPVMQANGLMQPIDWKGNLSHLYYDLAGISSPEAIRSLLNITTPEHLLYGSDYPYQPANASKANLNRLKKMLTDDKEFSKYADMILSSNAKTIFSKGEMLVRISEIEIFPQYQKEYLRLAKDVGAASIENEPGVIAIYPMIQKRDSCQIRILEIYASQEAYQHHITTEHFQTYKQGTLHMVKSLDLVDMHPLNARDMPNIFKKMNSAE